jgi:hypothetical protein
LILQTTCATNLFGVQHEDLQTAYLEEAKSTKSNSTPQKLNSFILCELQFLVLNVARIEVHFDGFMRTLCTSLKRQFENIKNSRNSNVNDLFGRIDRFSEEIVQIQQGCGVITGSAQQLQRKNLELIGYLQRMVPTFDVDHPVESIEMFSEEIVNLKVEFNGLKQRVASLQSESLTLAQSLEVRIGI